MKEKFKSAIEKNSTLDLKAGQYTVSQWLNTWMENYARMQVGGLSYKTYQGFISNHIKPELGDMPLEKLTAMDP